MPFAVPESKRSLNQNLFEFTVPGDDTVYRIPQAKYLTAGQVELLARNKDEVRITDVLDVLGQGDARDAVRSLDVEQLQALMAAWQGASDLQLGESSASTPTS